MEEEYEASRIIIDKEVEKFIIEVDPWNNELLKTSYSCISRCYKLSKYQNDVDGCIKICENKIAKQQKFIEGRLKSFANRFDDCTQTCYNLHGLTYSPKIQKCIKKCTALVSNQIKTLKKNSILIIKEYLNRQYNKDINE